MRQNQISSAYPSSTSSFLFWLYSHVCVCSILTHDGFPFHRIVYFTCSLFFLVYFKPILIASLAYYLLFIHSNIGLHFRFLVSSVLILKVGQPYQFFLPNTIFNLHQLLEFMVHSNSVSCISISKQDVNVTHYFLSKTLSRSLSHLIVIHVSLSYANTDLIKLLFYVSLSYANIDLIILLFYLGVCLSV